MTTASPGVSATLCVPPFGIVATAMRCSPHRISTSCSISPEALMMVTRAGFHVAVVRFDHEVGEGDDDLRAEDGHEDVRPIAAPFEARQGDEDDGVEEVAHRVQRQLARGGASAPWKARAPLVIPDGVEG